MSFPLNELKHEYAVDMAILHEKERLVLVRFGIPDAVETIELDSMLYKCMVKLSSMAIIYTVDITKVTGFNNMYELVDPCALLFFYRGKRMLCDFGTGNNNKLNFQLTNEQELIDIVEQLYRGAKKGKTLVVSVKNFVSRKRVEEY